MIPPCPRCGKDDFKKLRDRESHINRKFKCKLKEQPIKPTFISIDELENWLAEEIPSNSSSNKPQNKIPQTDAEWWDFMGGISNNTKEIEPTYQDENLKRKQNEHFLTWGARLRNRLISLGYGDKGLPRNLKEAEEWYHTISIRKGEFYFVKEGNDPSRPHKSLKNKAVWIAKNKTHVIYLPQIVAKYYTHFTEVFNREFNERGQFKSAIVANVTYLIRKKDRSGGPEKYVPLDEYHRGKMRILLSKNDIDDHITKSIGEIIKEIEEFTKKESDIKLKSINFISIEIYTYRRALGGSYKPTPKNLANKKCTINPDNKNLIDPDTGLLSEKCLQGALGAYFANKDGHTQNLERIFRSEKYKPYLNKVKLDGIPMPTPVCSRVFNKIEEMNPDISINVWEWKENTSTAKPVIASKNYNRSHIIHLLALTDIVKTDEKYGQKNHFLWIKNKNALIYKDSEHKEKKHLCDRCFQSFSTSKVLEKHQEWCFGLGEAPQKVTLPVKDKNDIVQFEKFNRMIYSPCVIIADFEADNKKCDENYGGKMHKIMEQKANSFSYMVHWIDTNETWGPYLYRGPNATEEFVKRLDNELRHINEVLAIKEVRKITKEAERQFANADNCWICKGKFDIDTDEIEQLKANKVWDHCHITGEFRGAAHSSCNLKLQIEAWKTPIPVVFHNFRGYDSHLVCESLGKSANAYQIKVIAETFERYKSMKVGQLKYIDSMQFMNSSLANLAKNLGKDKPITRKHFANYASELVDLITRKGVYPYQYIDSHDRFEETELPPIHNFYGHLNGKITQEDYNHARRVWNEFQCKNLGEYHDLYLKTDVLLLADIWTKFRQTSMQHYGLDPSHYVSAPALSWDAMLKMTEVKIELFTDMTMHDFIEKAKRGGISMAVHRYFKANNPKMGKKFNPSKPTTWISYIDANNLYGWAMSQYLPIGNYKWEASSEYLQQNPDKQKHFLERALNTKPDAKRGFFLNIKAHFPCETHDYLNDLPPAVENIAIKKDKLSPYITNLVNELDSGQFPETEKLVPHLGNREDYVIHYQELQYYVKLGMVIDEVTQVLSFDQSNWLAPYITFNTNLRQNAKNPFEKDFFKLMNNAVYGKTMENVRKYQDVKLIATKDDQDEKKFLNKIKKPSFKYARRLGETLIGAHMGKASVTLNKPIIVGASVLGLSKLHMYRFWYEYVKERYGEKAQLGYMDTDSFIFYTETEDIYKDMAEYPDIFAINGDVTIGKFKDETPGNVITESFHIRAKSYHYVLADNSTKSKHKGISKKGMNDMATSTYFPTLNGSLLDDPVNNTDNPMTLVYRDCLFNNEVFYTKNIGMRTKDHIISLIESEKKALSPIDTKRWIWSDGISSLPFGHWRISEYIKMTKDGISHEEAEILTYFL